MIKSPCIRECILDYDEDYCTGCFRCLNDIWDWREKSDEEKLEAIKRADALRKEKKELENNK